VTGTLMKAGNLTHLALALALVACRSQPHTAATTPASAHSPDAETPPIECPLAKQGARPPHLRPFEDAEKYIAFLERPERAQWQRPDAVVAALGLAGNETIADVGAGSGYFSFRLAAALPQGTVVATDVEPEMVRHIHHRVMSEGVRNLRVELGKPDDPGVPHTADWVLLCDVLHHIADRAAWLGKLANEMKPGARLALIEFKEGPLPEGPPAATKIPKAELVSLVTRAGLRLEREQPDLLPYQSFLVFKKP
jgi:ubiquinone/menaquinone biosynthesis C-methylase UbiE